MTDAGQILEGAMRTFIERNSAYKDNFVRIGKAMEALFPGGLAIHSAAEWSRMYFFMMLMTKLSRYATNWEKGGHADSAHDMIVYAALLEAFDANLKEERK